MDKILGVFTTIFVGVPLTVISFLISRSFDNEGRDTEQLNDDSDMRTYVPSRCRRRRGGKRRIKQVDEEGREVNEA